MFFKVSASIPVLDISVDAGFISKYDIRIELSGEPRKFEDAGLQVPVETAGEGRAVRLIGKAALDRLHIDLVEQSGASLFDVCDADSGEWEAVFSAFLVNHDGDGGPYQEIEQTEECLTRDVLLIQDIALEGEYRGRGLEMGIANRLIDTLGSGCDLVVYIFGEHTDELKALEPMGFQEGPIKGYAYLNLCFLHPRPIEAGFAKFDVKALKETAKA